MAADRDQAIQRLQAGLAILDKGRAGQAAAGTFRRSAACWRKSASKAAKRRGGRALSAAGRRRQGREAQGSTRRRSASFLAPPGRTRAVGELDKAADASGLLIDLGPDTPQVNAVLIAVRQAAGLRAEEGRGRGDGIGGHRQGRGVRRRQEAVASLEKLLGTFSSSWPSAGTVAGGNGLHRRHAQRPRHDRRGEPGVSEDHRTRRNRPGVRQDGRRGHDPRPRPIDRAAPQARQVRGGDQAGRRLDQGLSARLGTADGEGLHLRRLGGKGPHAFDESVSHWVMLRTKLASRFARSRPNITK